jgi:predicted nucleotidyltransferase
MSSVVTPFLPGRVINTSLIERLVGDIARLFDPEKIILFGSFAYCNPTGDSDVDLLIVMPHRGPGHRTARRVRGGEKNLQGFEVSISSV